MKSFIIPTSDQTLIASLGLTFIQCSVLIIPLFEYLRRTHLLTDELKALGPTQYLPQFVQSLPFENKGELLNYFLTNPDIQSVCW